METRKHRAQGYETTGKIRYKAAATEPLHPSGLSAVGHSWLDPQSFPAVEKNGGHLQ